MKFLSYKEWGEEYLLKIICHMWNMRITVLDVTDDNLMRHYGGYNGFPSDNMIVYNGNSHYSGTGKKIIATQL